MARYRRWQALTFVLGALGVYVGANALDPMARWVGYGVCHQWPTHSYAAGVVILPLCARCTGLYLGGWLTLFYLLVRGRERSGRWPPRLLSLGLMALIGMWVLDGVNSFVATLGGRALYPPSNGVRLLTGTWAGMALMVFFWPMFVRLLGWGTSTPILSGAGDGIALLALNVLPVVLVHWGNATVRHALGVLSALWALGWLTLTMTAGVAAWYPAGALRSRRTRAWALASGGVLALLLVTVVGQLRTWLT